MSAQMPGGNEAQIVTGNFGSMLKPLEDVIGDGLSDIIGLSGRSART